MPLHLTKIAYEATSLADLQSWFDAATCEKRLTTRYLPKRHKEMAGGSLYWIHQHAIVARSPLLRFEQKDDGRWWIVLENRLVLVEPRHKRAHQGWRYLAHEDAPGDLPGELAGEALPGRLIGRLAKLGLV
jgi:hypothetical protein